MKRTFFVLWLLLLVSAAFAAPVTLEYRHDGNEVNVYRESNKIVQKEDGQTVEVETVTEITETVKSPSPGLTLAAEVKTVSLKVNGEDQDVSQIPPSRFSYSLDKQGKVTASFDKDGNPTPGFDASRETALLPDKPVNKGDTWTGKLIMDTLNSPIECRLEEVYKKNGVELARISFTAEHTAGLADMLSAEDLKAAESIGLSGSKSIKGKGNIYFSTALGKVIMLEYTLETHNELSGAGQHKENDETEDYKMWRTK